MNQQSSPPLPPLEPTLTLARGGKAKRCQARNRAGLQCGKPSTEGFTVCGTHGAGYAKRVKAGDRLDPRDAGILGAAAGRVEAERRKGVAAKELVFDKPLEDSMVLLLELDDPDNSDAELAAVRAAFWKLIEGSAAQDDGAGELSRLLGELRGVKVSSLDDARMLSDLVREASGLQGSLTHYLERVQAAGMNVVTVIQKRASTRIKSLQVRLLEEFGRWVLLLRESLFEASRDMRVVDAFERDVRARVLDQLPLIIDLPPLESEPDPLEVVMNRVVDNRVFAVSEDIASYLEDAGDVLSVARADLASWVETLRSAS